MSEAQQRPVRDPEIGAATAPDGTRIVRLSGAWDIRALESRARTLAQALQKCARETGMRWDLSEVQRLDHIGALLIWRAWSQRRPATIMLNPEHEIFFSNIDGTGARWTGPGPIDLLASLRFLGVKSAALLFHVVEAIQLLGQMLLDTAEMLRHPSRGPWREISAGIYRIGTQALGITATVGFLIGVVLSYLSAEQLRTFGAGVLIVNILGIGIIRELGPVICAVLVAGRSGSAITAQLGVMRVTEELDALAVMGIPYTVRLVLPKVIALAIALPLLILWTSGIALFGGALSASFELGIGVHQFMIGLPAAVPTVNLWLGIGKGVVFGILIALVACHFGLRIKPNTESLGIGTTDSVVTSITVVIIADAVFAVLFNNVGIAIL